MRTSGTPGMQQAWLLMGAAILFWGVNWPIMKVGLDYIGPLWFAALRVMVATIFIFAFLGLRGRLSWPRRNELPILFSLGILQVGCFMGLIHYALLFVDAGRSAILTYTTPIWVAPLAVWFLAEKLTRLKLLGLLISVGGIVVLFNPFTFPWSGGNYARGNALLIAAAILWAFAIVHVRGFGWTRPHLSLLPWQLLLGATVLIPAAFFIEGIPTIPLTWDFITIMAFNGIVATAFSFWAFTHAARILPASSTAMGSLGVPVVGIISSVLILGEQISIGTAIGAGLILFGIATFTWRRDLNAPPPD